MSDFFEGLLQLGSEKGGWRSGWAIFGLVLGTVIGGYLGWTSGGFLAAAGSAVIGAFLGWVVLVLFKGFIRFLVLCLILLPVVLGWFWLTGKL